MTKEEKKAYDHKRYLEDKLKRQEQHDAWMAKQPGGKAGYMKRYWKRRKAREARIGV